MAKSEDQDKEFSFHVCYECRGSRRTTPMFLPTSTLAEMSFEDFHFNIVNGTSYFKLQKGVNWRLSALDGEDDVDLVKGKYLKIIMDIAKKHDKVILNVYESVMPSNQEFHHPLINNLQTLRVRRMITVLLINFALNLCVSVKASPVLAFHYYQICIA